MQRLYIVGAGGFGRELFTYCLEHPDHQLKWRVQGFLDDNLEALAGYDYPVKVVQRIRDFQPEVDDLLLCGIGIPRIKRQVCGQLLARGASFLTFIHPSAKTGHNVRLGQGVVLCPNVRLTCDISIADFVAFNCSSGTGHDVKVGPFSVLSGGCELSGGVQMGDEVLMGGRSIVMPRLKVGHRAVIGAGAVVVRHVKDGETVFGNPARTLVAPSA